MSGASVTEKVVSYKHVTQRAVKIAPPDYLTWLQPKLVQIKATQARPRLQVIRPEDCEFSAEQENLAPRFGEKQANTKIKVEIVESEVGIDVKILTAEGEALITKDYHMDHLNRFSDREGSYISILNECVQQTKNPLIKIEPILNNATSPFKFKCEPEANGLKIASVSGSCQTKADAKNFVASWLLAQLFPRVYSQTERFFKEKKEK